jgi:hypothetical protein
LNHSAFNARFKTNTRTMDNSPQGKIKKEDALPVLVAMMT